MGKNKPTLFHSSVIVYIVNTHVGIHVLLNKTKQRTWQDTCSVSPPQTSILMSISTWLTCNACDVRVAYFHLQIISLHVTHVVFNIKLLNGLVIEGNTLDTLKADLFKCLTLYNEDTRRYKHVFEAASLCISVSVSVSVSVSISVSIYLLLALGKRGCGTAVGGGVNVAQNILAADVGC